MDLVEFTREIVESLVVNTDGVTVKEFPTDEENTILNRRNLQFVF